MRTHGREGCASPSREMGTASFGRDFRFLRRSVVRIGVRVLAHHNLVGPATSGSSINPEFESNTITWPRCYSRQKGRDMEEDIFPTGIRLYESEAFVFLKQLDHALGHFTISPAQRPHNRTSLLTSCLGCEQQVVNASVGIRGKRQARYPRCGPFLLPMFLFHARKVIEVAEGRRISREHSKDCSRRSVPARTIC
ncbi:hypothetical protein SAMN05216337_104033 [Bradyrhizobium brasilense]|uniref:Uncharacterized protein n=1 Tax=Bradyrhizobium brasilense TaxID=1419277 RepID=A0A1G7H3X3_9BRAD|nr:hypothetical protein SAMN05216337_104033 [Bradyrhizobium brasilense]